MQQAPRQHTGSGGATPPSASGWLEKVLPGLSVFTMAMTVPQVWAVWVDGEVAGVSLLSWGAYLVSALLWFLYGLGKRDRTQNVELNAGLSFLF